MGAPSLKKKKELHYRRGYTSKSCEDCDHFFRKYEVRGQGGELLAIEPRCGIMGIKNGRAYRISPNNICDMFSNSELLKRLGVTT